MTPNKNTISSSLLLFRSPFGRRYCASSVSQYQAHTRRRNGEPRRLTAADFGQMTSRSHSAISGQFPGDPGFGPGPQVPHSRLVLPSPSSPTLAGGSLDRTNRTQGPAWTLAGWGWAAWLAALLVLPRRVPTDPLVAAPGRSGGYGAGPPAPRLRRAGGRPYRSQPGMRAFAGSCRHWRGHHPRSQHKTRNLRNISTKAKKGPNSHVQPCTST